MTAFAPGSSPLTRGKRRRYRIRGPDSGLIPAHAGKTTNRGAHATGTQAHPRSRGENLPLPSASWIYTGSSPLTRGKLLDGERLACARRLIPAHAGKTSMALQRSPRSPAHPRSCGENRAKFVDDGLDWGSSPLMRGKQGARCRKTRLRLIPAHAGKTTASPGVSAARPAHPRSRGENVERTHTDEHKDGSSPLTRGKQSVFVHVSDSLRLIPAHAGKTGQALERRAHPEAHPRSRGENMRISTMSE